MRKLLPLAAGVLGLSLSLAAQQQSIIDKANQIKALADQIIQEAGQPPAQPPVDCVVSPFSFSSAGPWNPATCPTSGQQTRSETWTRTVVTPASNGGEVCPALTETRTNSQGCTPPDTTPPSSGVGVISRMNCIASYPVCNLTGNWDTQTPALTKARITDTPKKFGGAEYTGIPTTQQGQPYAGWGLNVSHPSGQSRFFRFSIRMAAGFQANGAGDVWTDKLVIHGNGGSGDRVICVIAPRTGMTDLHIRCAKGIDFYPNGTRDVPLRVGQWDQVQVEVKNGSGGYIKMWVNNRNAASPSSASEPMTLNVPATTMIGFGFYHNAQVGVGGSMRLSLGDFEWASAFDPTW